jgi:glycosyltransferase involved in cell wall biosynthesis
LAATELGQPGVLILTYPDQLYAARAFPDATLVYDLMDEPELFRRSDQVLAGHREILRSADLTVVSSGVLLRRYQASARRIVCIGNGVDEKLTEELSVAEPCRELAHLPRPRLGYIGVISKWFDFETVHALAKAFPAGSVILVGPVHGACPTLPGNVVLVGPRSHDRLAQVLRTFDIGLIPFRHNRAIDAVDPVKLYEYLAAGLPVVAAWSEELAGRVPLVYLYHRPDQAVALARTLIACSSDDQIGQRMAFALGHTWRSKTDKMWSAISALTHDLGRCA